MYALVALALFFVTACYTVPAPKPPSRLSVTRLEATRYEGSPDPTERHREPHRAGKRGVGEWLASMFLWGAAAAWVYAFIKRFVQ